MISIGYLMFQRRFPFKEMNDLKKIDFIFQKKLFVYNTFFVY